MGFEREILLVGARLIGTERATSRRARERAQFISTSGLSDWALVLLCRSSENN